VHGSKPGIAAARGEDVRLGAMWKFFETAKNVVADTSDFALACNS
jgi:hypothetical protein